MSCSCEGSSRSKGSLRQAVPRSRAREAHCGDVREDKQSEIRRKTNKPQLRVNVTTAEEYGVIYFVSPIQELLAIRV